MDIHGKKHEQKTEFFCLYLFGRYTKESDIALFLKHYSEAYLSLRSVCDSSSNFGTGHSSCSQIKTSCSV